MPVLDRYGAEPDTPGDSWKFPGIQRTRTCFVGSEIQLFALRLDAIPRIRPPGHFFKKPEGFQELNLAPIPNLHRRSKT
ncbi:MULTISPECIES: hypothetical protein [Achromobacter]|jgi:hypothetical protein|uniref:hypothetical protein n=1 Tax=Achromobacter TaxID=222 RepID=UPI0012E25F2F|nr:hypothetical protein [Achromobacter kerstersii]